MIENQPIFNIIESITLFLSYTTYGNKITYNNLNTLQGIKAYFKLQTFSNTYLQTTLLSQQ